MSNIEIEQMIKENELLKLEMFSQREELMKVQGELSKVQKVKKVNKGTPMTFTNKSGKVIIGLGIPYFVVTMDKTLYYKQADSVIHLNSNFEPLV